MGADRQSNMPPCLLRRRRRRLALSGSRPEPEHQTVTAYVAHPVGCRRRKWHDLRVCDRTAGPDQVSAPRQLLSPCRLHPYYRPLATRQRGLWRSGRQNSPAQVCGAVTFPFPPCAFRAPRKILTPCWLLTDLTVDLVEEGCRVASSVMTSEASASRLEPGWVLSLDSTV